MKGFLITMVMFTIADDSSRSRRLEGYLNEIADGNMASLKLLYEETSAGVYSFTLSMLKNREDAEDTLQDVYLSIHHSAYMYKPMGRPVEWIMTIARNLCLSKLRQQSKTAPLNKEEEAVDYFEITDSDERIVLNEALSRLSDTERRIVVLHSVAGLKHHEIAAVLEIPASTSRSKYHRALKKLKKILSEGGA